MTLKNLFDIVIKSIIGNSCIFISCAKKLVTLYVSLHYNTLVDPY